MDENTLTLKKNEDGSVSQVVTTTTTNEVPFTSEELKRQIDEHQKIIDTLTPQYEAVKSFEESDDQETTVEIE